MALCAIEFHLTVKMNEHTSSVWISMTLSCCSVIREEGYDADHV
jgi:hypothetical protein